MAVPEIEVEVLDPYDLKAAHVVNLSNEPFPKLTRTMARCKWDPI